MRVEFIRSRKRFLMAAQFAGAIVSVMLGIAMFLQILIPDASQEGSTKFFDYVPLAALLVVPPLFLLVASYIQLSQNKIWGIVVLLIAGLCSLVFVGLNMSFTFLYAGDKLGQFEVLADIIIVVTTLAVAVVNGILPVRLENNSQ
jgi:hypothetical protein